KDGRLLLVEWHGAPILKGKEFDYFIVVGIDITERKQTEQTLRDSEYLLRESQKVANLGSYILDIPSGIWKSSLILDDVFGIDKKYNKDVSGWLQIIHPEDRTMIQDYLALNVLTNHEPFNKEYRIKRINDQQERWVQGLGELEFDDDGSPIKMLGTIQDITERKKSEILLKESEKKYRELFEKSNDAILIIENNKFVDCNDSTVKMLRYKNKKELLNIHPSVLSPEFQPDGRESFEKAEEMMNIAFQKGSHRFEWDHKKADGEVFPVEVLLTVVSKDDKNKILHTVWRDITKRKKAENELRESQQRMANHLENTPLAAIFWDLNFKVTDWNRSAEEIYGYSKAEALGKHANELIVPEELKENINNIFNHLLSQTGGYRGTNENVTKDGKRILCNWYNVAITDTSGKVTGVASLVDDITIRKRNIDELKKSEAKFKLLLENLPNAVFLTKLGGVNAGEIIYANPEAEKQTGYKKSKLIGMNIINDFLVEQETKLLKDKRENDLINDKILSFIEKKKRADSSVYTTRVMITSIEYENEKVNLSVNTDITEQVEAQAKVIESEKKYKSLFDNNLTAVYTSTVDGKILECNNAFVKMFGYQSKEEILKIDTNSLYKSDIGRKLFLEKLKDKKVISNFETIGIRKDGSVISTLISANLISDNIMQSSIFDITTRKKYQAEILKLSRGIEQSPNMIIITDLDGNIEYANPKITEVTGYTQKELIGKNPSIFSSGQMPKETFEELWDTILYGKTWKGELLNKRKNGELYWESVTIAPIIDNEGNILNYIAIKDDITEKREMREELIKAKEKAEELYKLKSSFLSNMSHELRTPLVGILGFTEILEEDIKDPELNKIASLINENGKRLLKTLNLILNLSKIESESVEIELTEFDVIKEVPRSVLLFEKSALKKNIFIKVKSNVDDLIIHSDVRIFYEILNNLINNAVKYTEEGGITVYVDITKDYKYAEIKVVDTGIGIPKDKREIIWEEFRQVSEGASRIYEGTGLGLTITNKYIKKLKGKITLESELGKGSTFTVLIPTNVMLYPTTPSISKSSKKELLDKEKFPEVKLPKLLYVEDDKIASDIVKRFLKNHYNIILAKDGIEGLIKAKNIKFDIILMDIDLKFQPDGIELTKHIRKLEDYKPVPIIAVSAYTVSDNKKKYLESGFTSYLAKPFTKKELISTLDNALNHKL
ncbi:MAG: PAS domain S-box protein, partial [Bacteroidetes bacterium]|nr:PAS domain S-box protein [Bacteroidota bacterium]